MSNRKDASATPFNCSWQGSNEVARLPRFHPIKGVVERKGTSQAIQRHPIDPAVKFERSG